jgi:predicted MFS family arabinose efflux permease
MSQIGTLLAGWPLAALSETIGWRWAFAAAGIVGVLYSIPLMFVLREVLIPDLA